MEEINLLEVLEDYKNKLKGKVLKINQYRFIVIVNI